jgi:hypothetical protein
MKQKNEINEGELVSSIRKDMRAIYDQSGITELINKYSQICAHLTKTADKNKAFFDDIIARIQEINDRKEQT